jgi:hypothetical protein
LSNKDVKNILIVGVDTVSVAVSAKRAGYDVYAADYFGDLDLQQICIGYKAIVRQKSGMSCGKISVLFKPEAFFSLTKTLVKKFRIDGILLSSGLDDDFEVLYALNDLAPILGNHPKTIEKIRRKQEFFEELKRLRIAHPITFVVENANEAIEAAKKLGFPVAVKPAKGFAGVGIRIAWSIEDLERAFSNVSSFSEKVLIQKLIEGVHASVSFLATSKDVEILMVNEQLLGLRFLFQQEPFGYCGNIVPLHLDASIVEKCREIAERIALHFGLKGSNGIDLVISKEGIPYVIEVNPRFQGTLECVEKILGINLVESHIDACLYNVLPQIRKTLSTFCTRLILYAPERVVAPNLTIFPQVRDIPIPGCIIEKGEPLCSVVAEGKSRNLALNNAKENAETIYSMLQLA